MYENAKVDSRVNRPENGLCGRPDTPKQQTLKDQVNELHGLTSRARELGFHLADKTGSRLGENSIKKGPECEPINLDAALFSVTCTLRDAVLTLEEVNQKLG